MVERVLVTGGAGFIGLVSGGFDVVVLDDFSSGRHKNKSAFW